jgi:hypothetical protein
MARPAPKRPAAPPATTEVAAALRDVLISPNVPDRNLEPANVVDVLHKLAFATRALADAVTVPATGTDAAGGSVSCLTEAVMGVTEGLHEVAAAVETGLGGVAAAIDGLAAAVRSHRTDD